MSNQFGGGNLYSGGGGVVSEGNFNWLDWIVCARLAQLVRSLTTNQKVLGSNPRPGRGLNFGRPSFATLSVDRDVKPLV